VVFTQDVCKSLPASQLFPVNVQCVISFIIDCLEPVTYFRPYFVLDSTVAPVLMLGQGEEQDIEQLSRKWELFSDKNLRSKTGILAIARAFFTEIDSSQNVLVLCFAAFFETQSRLHFKDKRSISQAAGQAMTI